jgi:predicted ATPase
MTPAPIAPTARRAGLWHVRLLGALDARSGDVVITRWPSQPTALLLATLALQPGRAHPREALIEHLWPGAPPEAGRNRLRQALSALRRLFEAPGLGLPALFNADRKSVRLNAATVRCDAAEFERALAEHRFADARAAWGGELMPGIYEDWVVEERERLTARFEALDSLAFSAGQLPPAAAPPAPAVAARLTAASVAPLLPAPGGVLLGREAELERLARALDAARLVTLTGPGGCGKTRLAVEVARQAGGFDLVAFVPLAECMDGAQAASQLRASLQLPLASAAPMAPLEQVAQMLAARRALVVLDNFEQVAAGSDLLQALLLRAPALTLLVTSRRATGVAGELEAVLAPLPIPEPGAGLAAVARNPSVALFVQSARGVRPDFQVTARNCAALAELCRALEGLPLAIELAAARARAFSVVEMQQALAHPLDLLARTSARGRRGARHDSMRAAIAWSWCLLAPTAQSFLAALSVFRGGWTVADTAAVTGRADARALLEGLACDSLVRSDAGGDAHGDPACDGVLRFRLLEVIRAYAAEQLDAAHAAALRVRHRSHFLAMAHALGAGQAPPADQLPNLYQALRSAVADGAHEVALDLLLALRAHWDHHGMPPDLLELVSATVEAGSLPRQTEACALLAQLQLDAGALGRARTMAASALACAGHHPAERAAALCAHVRVVAEGERRADGLPAMLAEAMALAAGAPALRGQVTELQAALAMRFDHDPMAAETLLQRAEHLYHEAGLPRHALLLRYERALCLREMGRLHAALEQAEMCEVECAHADDGVHRVRAIHLQGVMLAELRRWADALDAYRRCVREAWALHVHYWLVFALWNHGRNLAHLRRPELAARLMAFSERYWAQHFSPLNETDRRFARRVQRLVRVQIGRARAQAAWVEGAGWTLAQAVQAALAEDPG